MKPSFQRLGIVIENEVEIFSVEVSMKQLGARMPSLPDRIDIRLNDRLSALCILFRTTGSFKERENIVLVVAVFNDVAYREVLVPRGSCFVVVKDVEPGLGGAVGVLEERGGE